MAKKDARQTVAQSAELESRAAAAGLDPALVKQLLTILGPLMLDLIVRWLERDKEPKGAAVGHHEHSCESLKSAGYALANHADGDHQSAAHNFMNAAYLEMHCAAAGE